MGALTESSRLLGDAQVIEVQVVDLHADRKEFDIKRASVHHQLDIVRANIQKKEVCWELFFHPTHPSLLHRLMIFYLKKFVAMVGLPKILDSDFIIIFNFFFFF